MLNVDFCKIKTLHFTLCITPRVRRREHLRQFAANSFIIVEIDPPQRQTLFSSLLSFRYRARTRDFPYLSLIESYSFSPFVGSSYFTSTSPV